MRSSLLLVAAVLVGCAGESASDTDSGTGSTSAAMTGDPPGQTTGTSGDADTTLADATSSGEGSTQTIGTGDDSSETGSDSTGEEEVCDKPLPELAPVTWNVVDGPTPAGTRPVLGDGSDEQSGLQAILDAAQPGEVVFFPTTAAHYGISAPLAITTSIEVRGAGFGAGRVYDGTASFEGPELRALGPMSSMLTVSADNVTVRGLGFVGPGRPTPAVTERNEHGIATLGAIDAGIRGLTVEGNELRAFIGEAIKLRWVEGYIIRNNHATELGYAGILVQNSNFGLITGNRVVDVIGTAVTDDVPPIVNAYGVVITGSGTDADPICDHTIMSNNYVQNIPGWTGVMDHGGQFTLMMDNHAQDCDFGLALTGPGNDCLVVNNLNENSPRQGFWNIGRPRVGLIGNVFRGANTLSLSGAEMVITDNVSFDALGTQISQNGSYGALTAYEARNDWGNWTDWYEPEQPSVWLTGAREPAVPTDFSVTACDEQRTFTWNYDPAVPHHAFAIEASADGQLWAPLAFRPPHDGTWDFDTDAHIDWIPLDPLRYTTTSRAVFFRMRALHGDAVSGWSEIASAR